MTEAIDRNPQYADTYYERGCSKSQLQNYQAVVDFTQAIELDSHNTNIYYERGLAKFQLKDYQGAIFDFTQSIALYPPSADIYDYRGCAKYQLGDYQGANIDYTIAFELEPDEATYWKLLDPLLNTQLVEAYKDFSLESDEKISDGSIVFIKNEKYIVVKKINRRVYHCGIDGRDSEGFNPDLSENQGWVRHTFIAQKFD